MNAQNVVTMGVHVLDVLVRPVEEIPEGQGATLVEDIRMTAAGTAAGTALTLAKLGASVRTAGAIGTDPTGDLLTQLLDKAGIDTELLVRRIDTSTSATVLPIRPNGDRPTLHLLGANITYGLDDVPWDAVAEASHLHLGGPELIGAEVAARILAHAKDHGVTTSVDLLAPGELGTFDQIEPLLPYVDFLLPNEDQVLGFSEEEDLVTGRRSSWPGEWAWSRSPVAATAPSWSPPRARRPSPPSRSTSSTPPAAATPSRRASCAGWAWAVRHARRRSWAVPRRRWWRRAWAATMATSTWRRPTSSP